MDSCKRFQMTSVDEWRTYSVSWTENEGVYEYMEPVGAYNNDLV